MTEIGLLNDPAADAAVRFALYRRLLLYVLPEQGRRMLRNQQHAAYVHMLFPVSRTAALTKLLDSLGDITGMLTTFEGAAKFLLHVEAVWREKITPYRINSVKISGITRTIVGVDEDFAVWHRVRDGFGHEALWRFEGSYRGLGSSAGLLGLWLAAGDAVFSAEEQAMVYRVAAFWVDMLNFDVRGNGHGGF